MPLHTRIEEEWEKSLDELWNEHDGTHFYKDEFKSFISSLITQAKAEERERIVKIIESINEEGTYLIRKEVIALINK